MFKKLKDKLKGALNVFSKKAEEEATEEIVEKPKEEVKTKPAKPAVKEKKVKKEKKKEEKKEKVEQPAKLEKKEPEVAEKEEIVEEKTAEPEKVVEKAVEEVKEVTPEPEKKGFFKRVTEKVSTVNISEEKFDELFWPLEVILLENNVALEVVEKIKSDMKEDLANTRVKRKEVEDIVTNSLKSSIEDLFEVEGVDLLKKIKEKKDGPYVISFIGINGSGKTTSMAKVANMLLKNNLTCVFAAADTFRAASMEQLQEHADNLKVKMIKHDYQSDPAAVAFDAVQHAKSKKIDVVLIDTAGRLHSNKNLMDELEKLIRVNKPDLKVFVGESTTGNDCVQQAKQFDEVVGIDVIILTKADVDEKGGAAISISFVTGKPIIYLGTGQTYADLTKFDSEVILKNLF